MGCSPGGREESDTTERLHFHFSLLCIGEGNGSPLQCSCLENPRDGVAQSRTRLKCLSSSSSEPENIYLQVIHFLNLYIMKKRFWVFSEIISRHSEGTDVEKEPTQGFADCFHVS